MFDVMIIGSGPAGLTAGIFAARRELKSLIIGQEIGGQMVWASTIENYPGFVSIESFDLVNKIKDQVEKLGVPIKNEEVLRLEFAQNNFILTTSKGKYQSPALILAIGLSPKRLAIPGEKEFTGLGVSYCATCDAMFFRDKIVSVIGGGNSAAIVALELADFASKVYLISRDERLSADPAWLDKIAANAKIEVIRETNVIEIKGQEKVEKIVLDKVYDDKTFLTVDGIFIEIGSEPGVELARKLGVETDEQNFIKVGSDQSTNVAGVFAAGDITTGSNKLRQILIAASEGALAANSTYKKLKL